MKPHPEGGHYRETFRDTRLDANGRALSTAIYFLLARGERSHWHRIDAVEIWHYYAGSALTLQIAHDGGRGARVRLGPDLAAGEVPQAIVPAQAWQAAESDRRLDAGRMHRGAGIRICGIRIGAEGLGACELRQPRHSRARVSASHRCAIAHRGISSFRVHA